jgi:peptide chain release factor 2
MVTAEQIKSLGERLERLKSYLNLEQKRIHIINEEEKTASPEFWNDPKEAEKTMKALRGVKYWVEGYEKAETLFGEAELSLEFYKEGELEESDVQSAYSECEDWIEELEFKNMLSGEEDKLSAVLQITAGAGGTESCDWASMLMRMYLMYAEKQGFKTKELVLQEGDVAGIKTVTIEIDGDYAFGFLKGENGVHRLVRISPFDSNAKRHTSFVSVYVFPLVDDTIDIQINMSDIEWDTFRSSGCRWSERKQGRNRGATAPQAYWIIIENTETRSQLGNKEKAIQLLKSQLYEMEIEARNAKRAEIEAGKKKIEWGSQIRNYVMHPYKLVKDVRTAEETSDVDGVMNGNIDRFLKAFLMQAGRKCQC